MVVEARNRREQGEKLINIAESMDVHPNQMTTWSWSSSGSPSSKDSSKKNFKPFASLATIRESLLQ